MLVEEVAAMGLGARERVIPGVGAPARGGVAAAAALDVGDQAGADKELAPPRRRPHCLMIGVFFLFFSFFQSIDYNILVLYLWLKKRMPYYSVFFRGATLVRFSGTFFCVFIMYGCQFCQLVYSKLSNPL